MSVKIYKPAKNAMQSGKGNSKKWIMEHELNDSRYIDPVMGWTGNADTKYQVKLKFDTQQEAIEYAKRKGLEYIVIEPNRPTLKIQAYSDNFI